MEPADEILPEAGASGVSPANAPDQECRARADAMGQAQ